MRTTAPKPASKIIFLDIDGVLAHYESNEEIDPVCVARLDKLVEETGADIVISSTWRASHSLEEIQVQLEMHGFRGRIVDATPVLLGATRGEEIAEYLASIQEPLRFVILDDVNDVGDLVHHLILVDDFVGLQDEDVERCLNLLSNDVGYSGWLR